MTRRYSDRTRRDFLAAAGGTAGVVAAAALGGPAEAQAIEINAMQPTPQQIQAFMALPDEPVVMLNLLKFKPDGGREAYMKYAAAVIPMVEKLGGRLLFQGECKMCLVGNADWDTVALVEYPTPKLLIRMSTSPEYQAIHRHRETGLEGQVNYALIKR